MSAPPSRRALQFAARHLAWLLKAMLVVLVLWLILVWGEWAKWHRPQYE